MSLKYTYIALMGVLLTFFASSCAKKSNPPAPSPTLDMKATVSGTAWKASSFKASTTSGLDSVSGFRATDSSTILLLFHGAGLTNGDTLTIGSVNTIEYFLPNGIYTAISGYIVVTSYANPYITGTFVATVEDFNTSDKINISGGSFTAKL